MIMVSPESCPSSRITLYLSPKHIACATWKLTYLTKLRTVLKNLVRVLNIAATQGPGGTEAWDSSWKPDTRTASLLHASFSKPSCCVGPSSGTTEKPDHSCGMKKRLSITQLWHNSETRSQLWHEKETGYHTAVAKQRDQITDVA